MALFFDFMTPTISVIMPVFNTGAYLQEAVNSVLAQRSVEGGTLPAFELLLVDDHSTDPVTVALLEEFTDPRIKVILNTRAKGAAGARNCGVLHARGEWISFLDSDDLLFHHSLSTRWQVVTGNLGVDWVGAKFRLLKPSSDTRAFPPAAVLLDEIPAVAFPPVSRLERPVARFAQSCFIGIMSVLIRKSLLIQKGMFSEALRRAEDYHLWFQCALDHDLWLVDVELAFYRIHDASLTHGHAPRYLHEDAMLEKLETAPDWAPHRALLRNRYDLVMQDSCYFYRGARDYRKASATALQWLRKRPFNKSAWKELLACSLRAG